MPPTPRALHQRGGNAARAVITPCRRRGWRPTCAAYPCHTLQNPPASTNTVTALTRSSSSCRARAIQVLSCLVISSSPLILAVLLLAEREAVADMLRRLSRLSPPSLQPVYTMSGRRPFQGYYSPCSGRHYCLRGMDYYVNGDAAIRSHLNTLAERTVRLG